MPHVRSIFLSDIHLGTRACQAQRLVDFLREYESDYLFLVGDIVDLWVMSRGVYWSAAQNTVVQKVLKRARHGARVVLVPGNHDEALREYVDTSLRRYSPGARMHSHRCRWQALRGAARRRVRSGHALPSLGGGTGRPGLYRAGTPQSAVVAATPHPRGPRLLVASRLREAQGKVGGELHLQLRRGGGAQRQANAVSTA